MLSTKQIIAYSVALLASTSLLSAQGAVDRIYQQHCAVCHGAEMRGGLGGSLLSEQLTYGDHPNILARIIRDGLPDDGMEAFGEVLSEEEIHSLVVYIREMRARELDNRGPRSGDDGEDIFQTEEHDYKLEVMAETSGEIWGMDFFPNGDVLFTEKEGMEQPVIDWTPSIAVCGIAFYTGDRFPNWRNNLFVGGLAAQVVHRVVLDGDEAVHEEVILRDRGRIRDIANGPDGYIYLAINVTRHEGRSEIVRIKPID